MGCFGSKELLAHEHERGKSRAGESECECEREETRVCEHEAGDEREGRARQPGMEEHRE